MKNCAIPELRGTQAVLTPGPCPGNGLPARGTAVKIDQVSNVDGLRLGARAAQMLARTGLARIAPGLTDGEVSRVAG